MIMDDLERSKMVHGSILMNPETKTGEESIHICKFCGKRFGCGKGLGGHMKKHIPDCKDGILKKKENLKIKIHIPKKIEKISEEDSASKFDDNLISEEKPRCCICNKHFPSKKALCGHMRCHRERDWRGIQPPAAPPSAPPLSENIRRWSTAEEDQTSSSTTSETMNRTSSDVVMKWSVTGKRGRSCIGAAAAAYTLLGFANEKYRSKSKKPSIEQFPDEDEENPINEVKKKMKWENSLRDSLEIDDVYKCSTCDKSFTTFQALGGHRSLHNKEKKSQLQHSLNHSTQVEEVEASQSGSKLMLGFDLNEVPAMEDEDVTDATFNQV